MDIFSITATNWSGASVNALSYSMGGAALERLSPGSLSQPGTSAQLPQSMAALQMQQQMANLLQILSTLLNNQPGHQTQPQPHPSTARAASTNLDSSPVKSSHKATGTGYYPDNSAMEGGFNDRRGHKLNTLQDFLAGKADYVSVAMDKNEKIPYGAKLRIPELEKKYGRPIEFRVVDTGGAFTGKGTSRIDICTASQKDSLDPTVNGPLTLQFV